MASTVRLNKLLPPGSVSGAVALPAADQGWVLALALLVAARLGRGVSQEARTDVRYLQVGHQEPREHGLRERVGWNVVVAPVPWGNVVSALRLIVAARPGREDSQEECALWLLSR